MKTLMILIAGDQSYNEMIMEVAGESTVAGIAQEPFSGNFDDTNTGTDIDSDELRESTIKLGGQAAKTCALSDTDDKTPAVAPQAVLENEGENAVENLFDEQRFASLRNIIIDLFEQKSDNFPEYHAAGLMLLFENSQTKHLWDDQITAIASARQKLRKDIAASSLHEDSKIDDSDLAAGIKFLRQLISPASRSLGGKARFRPMPEVVSGVRLEKKELTDEKIVEQYVKSRIAYALHVLYSGSAEEFVEKEKRVKKRLAKADYEYALAGNYDFSDDERTIIQARFDSSNYIFAAEKLGIESKDFERAFKAIRTKYDF